MTAVPAVWSNPTNECFAGVKISNKTGSAIIPLEDAIALVAMFKSFDPIVYAASMLEFFGKIPKVTAIEVTNRPVYQAPQSIRIYNRRGIMPLLIFFIDLPKSIFCLQVNANRS
jgi:hypothetical protein